MIEVYDDKEAVNLAAARLLAEEARRAVAARGSFTLLLSGGETPRRSYQLLGQEPLRSQVPWQALQLFWGDERYVPHDHPLSNFGMVRAALLDRLPLNATQVHPIPYEASAHESALKYEQQLHGYFGAGLPRFDLVLLGLGGDGHTASLFPASAALREASRWVCELYVAEQDLYRITVTAPVLNQAALVVFLVAGGDKAAILHEVLAGARDPQRLPAQLIDPGKGRLVWLVDRDAASQLSESELRFHRGAL